MPLFPWEDSLTVNDGNPYNVCNNNITDVYFKCYECDKGFRALKTSLDGPETKAAWGERAKEQRVHIL